MQVTFKTPTGSCGKSSGIRNSCHRIDASTALKEPPEWNASLIKGDIAKEVAKLKTQQNILIYSCGLAANLRMQHSLVDQLNLWVYPIVMGKGSRK